MRTSFLDYAMSVIVSPRAADVRDGLKPVHRPSSTACTRTACSRGVPTKNPPPRSGTVMSRYPPGMANASIYDTLCECAAVLRCATPRRRPGQLRLDRR